MRAYRRGLVITFWVHILQILHSTSEDVIRSASIQPWLGQMYEKKSAGSLMTAGVLESLRKHVQAIRMDFLHIPSAQKHVPTPSELGASLF